MRGGREQQKMRRVPFIRVLLAWLAVTAFLGSAATAAHDRAPTTAAATFTVLESNHAVWVRGPGSPPCNAADSTWTTSEHADVQIATFWACPSFYGGGAGDASQLFHTTTDSVHIEGSAGLAVALPYAFEPRFADAQSDAWVRFRLETTATCFLHVELSQELEQAQSIPEPGWSEWQLEYEGVTFWRARLAGIVGTSARVVDVDSVLSPGEYVLSTVAHTAAEIGAHRAGFRVFLRLEPVVAIDSVSWSAIKELYRTSP